MAGGGAGKAGDAAGFVVAEGAVEIVRRVAVPGVEDKEGAAVPSRLGFEARHEAAGDAAPAPVGVDQELGDLGAMAAVGALGGLELDGADDAAGLLGQEEESAGAG